MRKAVTAMIVLTAVGGVAWAGWKGARKLAADAKAKGDDIHKELPEHVKKIVGAMCQASDDDLRSAGDSAASDARSRIEDKVDDFHHKTDDAITALQPIADDSDDGNHDQASRLIDDLREGRRHLDELTQPIMDGRPPVIDYIVRQSDSARSEHRSQCSSRDVYLDGGTVPCIVEGYDGCTVLEVAFDNDRSLDKARDRAEREKEWVEREVKKDSPSSAVAKCKTVTAQVDCFKVCPDIDNDGQFRDSGASWRERCGS